MATTTTRYDMTNLDYKKMEHEFILLRIISTFASKCQT